VRTEQHRVQLLIAAGVVALELVLAQSEMAAVSILALHAYPTGFGFDLQRAVRRTEPMVAG
jgi:hypothetical protein